MTGELSYSYNTYRKPQSTYDYLPFNSCTPYHTKTGIIITETIRMLRTNSSAQAYLKQLNFFKLQLQKRGYPGEVIQNIFNRYPWFNKNESLKKKPNRAHNGALAVFKIPFCNQAEELHISAAIRRHKRLLDCDNINFLCCWIANKNLFRLRYGRFIQ